MNTFCHPVQAAKPAESEHEEEEEGGDDQADSDDGDSQGDGSGSDMQGDESEGHNESELSDMETGCDQGSNGSGSSDDEGGEKPEPGLHVDGAESQCDSQETLILPGREQYELDMGDQAAMEVDSPSQPASTQSESSDSDVEEINTPERKVSWNEEFFTTPRFGNSGPRRADIVEMCVALMQYFGANHPDIMKFLI